MRAETMRAVGAVATDLTYKEVLSGETHHAAHFRLQIEDTVVNGMDYILLDADGKIAEVTIWWRPLPSGVQMQRHLAGFLGMIDALIIILFTILPLIIIGSAAYGIYRWKKGKKPAAVPAETKETP